MTEAERLAGAVGAVVSGVGVGIGVGVGVGVGVGATTALFTVTVMLVAVPTFPAASFAATESVCFPLATFFVSQTTLYGATVSAESRFVPSSLNCTETTPTLSEAFAETTTEEPETVAPFAGEVREMAGAVVSTGETVVLGGGGVLPSDLAG